MGHFRAISGIRFLRLTFDTLDQLHFFKNESVANNQGYIVISVKTIGNVQNAKSVSLGPKNAVICPFGANSLFV